MSLGRVLLVEDEALVALVMEDLIQDLGYEISGSIGDLDRALDWLATQTTPPDLAVLDINLGGVMVYPLAEELVRRGVPFVFCTGYASASDPRFADAPLIRKPIDPAALGAALGALRGA